MRWLVPFKEGNKMEETHGWGIVAVGVSALFGGGMTIRYGVGIETIWVIIVGTIFVMFGVVFVTLGIVNLLSRNK